MNALPQAILRFSNWFVDDALPLWAARGYDHERGGFYETLDFNGQPITAQPRRVRVQARQIYTFTQAGRRGWLADAEALAAQGFEYFLSRACPDGGARGCVHMVSDDGTILDSRRDLYDQAFLLLACAARWQAANDERALKLADQTMSFLDAELASPDGGWFESDKRELPRRQNPHMHLFEAFLALFNATGDQRFLVCAARVFELFRSAFYDPSHDVVREYFDVALQTPDKTSAIEPGHMFEWVWLLKKYEKASGLQLDICQNKLFTRAAYLGEDENFYGFVANQVPDSGAKGRTKKRLWPQTEYLKACLVQAADGNERARNRAAALINNLFETYLNVSTRGLWLDEYDGDGAPISKDAPASILYHLFESVAESVDYAKTMERS